MNLRSERQNDVTIISIPSSTLDSGNAVDFKRSVAPLLGNSRNVLLDLSSVEFMDSAGLGAILSVLKKVSSADGELRLCGPGKEIRTLLELVRMHRIMDVYSGREQAIRSFGV